MLESHVLQLTTVAVCIRDREGAVLHANGRAAELWPPGPCNGNGNGADPDLAATAHRSALAGTPSRYEQVHAGKHVETLVEALRDAQGNVTGTIAVGFEVTGPRAAERTIRTLNEVGRKLTSELNLEKLVQVTTDAATSLVGAQFGAFFYKVANGKGDSYLLYTLSGAPKEAFENFPMPRSTALFGPTFRGEGVVRCDDVRKDPRYGHNAPHYGMPKGHLPVASYLAVPVISRSGAVLGGLFFGHAKAGRFTADHESLVVGIASSAAVAIDNAHLYRAVRELNADLERRVNQRTESLQQTIRELDTFAYTVAHDLRAPLRAISGHGQILLTEHGEALGTQPRGHLNDMVAAAVRMDQLIRDLLDYARISREDVHLESVSLEAAVKDVLRSLDGELRERKAAVQVCRPFEDVLAHGVFVRQALSNLVSNAAKFVAPGVQPQIRIRGTHHGDCYRLLVEDNGIGIAPEHHQRIFDVFERLHVRETYPGTGIGLAIVRRVAERMGAAVGVESEPGVGSRFYLDFKRPASAAPEDLDTETGDPPPPECADANGAS